MPDPLVSVIVLGWGGEPYIAGCLAALRQQAYPALEVIVVDNGSPDRTAAIVERDFAEVQLIRTGQNLGVAGGNNVGLRAARGEICVLINADVQVQPGWLAHLVEAMQADARIGIAGARLLYPDGTIQFAGGRIEPPQGYPRHPGQGEADRGQFDAVSDVDFVTGASLAIRRSTLERIGYEDVKFYPIDLEDADMSYRARAAGFRVVLVPAAVAIHHESSTARAWDPGRALSLEAGRVRFVCKHWPAARLRAEFLPAESEFLSRGPAQNRTLLRWVYLKALGDIKDLAIWRQRLGVGGQAESLALLAEVLSRLAQDCLPQPIPWPADERVGQILEAWFAPADEDPALLLSLYRLNARVEPHQPIAWPDWPAGLWPKAQAAVQKLTRRLLRWYIEPIVEQQNALNAAYLHALETLAREVALLRQQAAGGDEG